VSVTSHACSWKITEEEIEEEEEGGGGGGGGEEEEAEVQSAARNATFLLALSAALAGEGRGPEAS